MENKLTHFDDKGNAIMVDVSDKDITERVAIAKGKIFVNDAVMSAIINDQVEKGDVLGVARVAGIMACKRTSDLIPMCHPLMITKCTIDFNINRDENYIEVKCLAKVNGKTGVEMEALTGVNIALLTIYDMCKAIDKKMEIGSIYLEKKTGGKSGEFINER